MQFWKAFNIFLFLLKAREWYIIADNEDGHIVHAHIAFGKVLKSVETIGEDVNGDILLNTAKELLK